MIELSEEDSNLIEVVVKSLNHLLRVAELSKDCVDDDYSYHYYRSNWNQVFARTLKCIFPLNMTIKDDDLEMQLNISYGDFGLRVNGKYIAIYEIEEYLDDIIRLCNNRLDDFNDKIKEKRKELKDIEERLSPLVLVGGMLE